MSPTDICGIHTTLKYCSKHSFNNLRCYLIPWSMIRKNKEVNENAFWECQFTFLHVNRWLFLFVCFYSKNCTLFYCKIAWNVTFTVKAFLQSFSIKITIMSKAVCPDRFQSNKHKNACVYTVCSKEHILI